MKPWLSILIPVYNVEQYLAECLDSVISQADEKIEIIALDDQSTDQSFALLNSLAKQSPHPIKILQHEKNSGLSAARNTLLEASSGDFIWFLDSDDALEIGAVAQLKKIVGEHSPDLVLCDYKIWRETPTKNKRRQKKEAQICCFAGKQNQYLTDADHLFNGLYQQGKLHAWSKISKRDLWQDGLRFPVGKYYEDMMTTPQLLFSATSYVYCPQVWVKYRQRQGSILSTPSLQKINDMVDALIHVLPLWETKQPPLSAATRFEFMVYCVRTYQFALKDLQRLKDKQHILKTFFRDQIIKSSGLNKKEFMWEFIKRGRFIRLLRFLR